VKRFIAAVLFFSVASCSAPGPTPQELLANRDRDYAKCRTQYPPKVGNFTNLNLCEDPSFLVWAVSSGIDERIAENLVKVRDNLAAAQDSGKLSSEEAQLRWKSIAAEAEMRNGRLAAEAKAERRQKAAAILAQGFRRAGSNFPTQTNCMSTGAYGAVSTTCSSYTPPSY